jgi:NitT/TauT family transport system permease protein
MSTSHMPRGDPTTRPDSRPADDLGEPATSRDPLGHDLRTTRERLTPTISQRPRLWTTKLLARVGYPILGLTCILLAWQGLLAALDTPSYIFPKPTDVVSSVTERGDLLWESAARTAIASASGLGLAIVLGVAGAIFLALSKVLERSLLPYAIVVQTTPIVAIAPIIVIWIGAGMRAIIIVAFIISFFPILSNTLVGVNSADVEVQSLFRMHDASRWQTMRKLRLPTSLPYLMAGVRISGGLAVIGAIVGEFVAGIGGGRGGLGYVIQVSAKTLDTSYLMAAAIAGSGMGILFYLTTMLVSRRVLAWHESTQEEEKGGWTEHAAG